MKGKGCNCCYGDEALYYKDNQNCAFIDSNGEMMVIANGRDIKFRVQYCPNCGMRFNSEN